MKNNLNLTIAALVGSRWAGFLEQHLRRAHELLRSPLEDMAVTIAGDALMRKLHHRYLGDSASTDVLTFELDKNNSGAVVSGQIVICLPVARRAAKIRGIPIEKELLLYALHGMLHLAGFDDRTVAGFNAMHKKEDQILIQMGIGPVFRPKNPQIAGRRRSRGAVKSGTAR